MGDKAILVTRDPVFVNKNIINGRYIGVRPNTYLPLAIVVTVLNPLLGPVGILFACKYWVSFNTVFCNIKMYNYFNNLNFEKEYSNLPSIDMIHVYNTDMYSNIEDFKGVGRQENISFM